jgi:hypothetical protein
MIKKILSFVLLSLLSFFNLHAQSEDAPTFKFVELKHDFGDITQGDILEHYFEFENTGSVPLIISNIISTCGCTAPTWPKDPIKPGEKGKIKIVFDSAGKMGRQNKVVTILSNASNQKERLFIIANVIPKS